MNGQGLAQNMALVQTLKAIFVEPWYMDLYLS
jgi:hypothetical protein